jgi:transposase-like protein
VPIFGQTGCPVGYGTPMVPNVPGMRSGVHYPRNWEEFVGWFVEDGDCRDYLDWLRWPNGFICPWCASDSAWQRADGRWDCAGCRRVVSQTAGTVFDKTRTPLTLWFAAAWHMTNQKNGISALGLKRELHLGSAQTAWHMLHRLRSAMVRADRTPLHGEVEVDETLVGGEKHGPRGRGSLGKSLVAVAVELKRPKGYGRCRLSVVPDAGTESLQDFVRANVERGSALVTDGWPSYVGLGRSGDYEHTAINLSASELSAHEELPAVHRVASLLKRWLLGTHQGAVSPEHLQSYLEEFTFRFNRRTSRRPGQLFYRLLEGAVTSEPLTYDQLVKIRRPKGEGNSPTPPTNPQLVRQPLRTTERPWRDVG